MQVRLAKYACDLFGFKGGGRFYLSLGPRHKNLLKTNYKFRLQEIAEQCVLTET